MHEPRLTDDQLEELDTLAESALCLAAEVIHEGGEIHPGDHTALAAAVKRLVQELREERGIKMPHVHGPSCLLVERSDFPDTPSGTRAHGALEIFHRHDNLYDLFELDDVQWEKWLAQPENRACWAEVADATDKELLAVRNMGKGTLALVRETQRRVLSGMAVAR
jgi:hypothetical protein